MTDRMISMSLITDGAESWMESFQKVSEIATDLEKSESFKHISVTATRMDVDDSAPEIDPQGLYFDENTLTKVRRALKHVLEQRAQYVPESMITDLVIEMQNEGILFREQR